MRHGLRAATGLAIAGAIALATAVSVLAHQPEANLGTPDGAQPYDVPRPDISRSIRGVVPAGGTDWYRFDLAEPTALTVWLLTPSVPACQGFSPRMVLYGAPVDPAEWQGRAWYGATVVSRSRSDGGWELSAERWGSFTHGETSRSGPWARPLLPAGTYWLAVEAGPERGGAYTFAIGDLEIPGGGVNPGLQAYWRTCPQSWTG
jgi:hypothetical protein